LGEVVEFKDQAIDKRRMNQRLASNARNLVTLLAIALIFRRTSLRRKVPRRRTSRT